MPQENFTSRWIESVKGPAEGRIEYFDEVPLAQGQSFGLRVSARNIKTFFVLYRHHGRLRRLTVGRYQKPSFGLADAKTRARQELAKLLQGTDPAAEKQARKRAETFEQLADAYLERYAKPNKVSWRRDQEIIDRDLKPFWGHFKAADVKRCDVIERLDAIVDRGAPIAANRALALVSRMYNWAISREIVEHNPATRIEKPGKERSRERILSADEIKTFWAKLPETDMSEPVRIALKLMLVTAQRKGEVINAAKAEFDLNGGWWTIPESRTKNELSHRVPLPSLAVKLVKEALALLEDKGEQPYLFPSPRGGKPILAGAVDHAVRKTHKTYGIAHFTPHDLRRTAASMMTSMGVPRLTVAKILNHVESGVTATYDRHSYDAEKRKALNRWARKLEDIVGGESSNVVNIR